MSDSLIRCPWCEKDNLYRDYHDQEWGVPVHDDRLLFEFLILEGAQAGLSWYTILSKRDAYREAYEGFEPERVARFSDKKTGQLLANPGIVRNRLKIVSSVKNARCFLDTAAEYGSFASYIWGFVGGNPRINRPKELKDVAVTSPESDILSADLKRRGFSFVGSTIIYSYMQAVGLVNDHLVECFRYRELSGLK